MRASIVTCMPRRITYTPNRIPPPRRSSFRLPAHAAPRWPHGPHRRRPWSARGSTPPSPRATTAVSKRLLPDLAATSIKHADMMRLRRPIDAREPDPFVIHFDRPPRGRAATMPADPCTGARRRRLPTGHPSRPPAGARVPPGARGAGRDWSLPASWPDPSSLTELVSDHDERYRGQRRSPTAAGWWTGSSARERGDSQRMGKTKRSVARNRVSGHDGCLLASLPSKIVSAREERGSDTRSCGHPPVTRTAKSPSTGRRWIRTTGW